MRESSAKFYMILSQSLLLFIIQLILTSDKEASIVLIAIIGISFMFAYSGAILYPKLIDKFGYNNYKTILLLLYGVIGQIFYIVLKVIGLEIGYTEFILSYMALCIITYQLNKRIYIREINKLNNLIKNNK